MGLIPTMERAHHHLFIQLSFIYIALNYNNSCFKVLYVVKRLHIVYCLTVYYLFAALPASSWSFDILLFQYPFELYSYVWSFHVMEKKFIYQFVNWYLYDLYFVGVASLSIVSHSCDLRI